MDFGYDLLANPQKVKVYEPNIDVKKSPQSLDIEKNIELLGREIKPDLIIDMIEDEIVDYIPSIHTKIDNQILREIIHLSIKNYQKIQYKKKIDSSPNVKLPTRNIIKPKIEKPKLININHTSNNFGLKKLH